MTELAQALVVAVMLAAFAGAGYAIARWTGIEKSEQILADIVMQQAKRIRYLETVIEEMDAYIAEHDDVSAEDLGI